MIGSATALKVAQINILSTLIISKKFSGLYKYNVVQQEHFAILKQIEI